MAACTQAYIKQRPDANQLLDLVAAGIAAEAEADVDRDGDAPSRPAKRARIYTDHRPMSEITAGIKAGRLHQVLTATQATQRLAERSIKGCCYFMCLVEHQASHFLMF